MQGGWAGEDLWDEFFFFVIYGMHSFCSQEDRIGLLLSGFFRELAAEQGR